MATSVKLNFILDLSPWGSPRYKGKRTRCKAYYDWFLERNPVCCVPGCGKPSTRDHVIAGRSRNARASDFLIVNICIDHHMRKGGNKTFQARYGVNFAEIIERNLIAFCEELSVTDVFNSLEELETALLFQTTIRKAA